MAGPAGSLESPPSPRASDVLHAQPSRSAKLPPPPLYTTSTSRPFSRSALKRQSVMALPSIQHLQHGFAKLGLKEAKKRGETASRRTRGWKGEDKENEGRAGGLAGMTEDEEEGEDDSEGILGPEPPKPELDLRMPWEKEGVEASLRDERQLRREVDEALDVVCEKWGLAMLSSRTSMLANTLNDLPHAPRGPSTFSSISSAPTSSRTDISSSASLSPLTSISSTSDLPVPLVLSLLTLTTGAIRTIQQFILSLPFSSSYSASTATATDPPQLSTASRPRTSLASPFATAATMSRSCSSGSNQGNQAADEVDERTIMLTALRKKTLEVLEMLSEMEGRYRLRAPQRLLADEGKGMVASPLETEAPTLPGVVIASEGPTKNTANDEKPINRSNITLPSLAAEQDVVRDWVEVAKRLLEQTPAVGANRRWSEARDGVSQQDVPEWAMKDGWEDSLSRAYAIIVAQLSDDQTAALPDPSEDRAGSLDALSNGYLLCLSYNATLRLSSPHPFGFISPSSIHPFPLSLSSSTEMYRTASSANDGGGRGEKIGQTFRRAENLRLWAGALKHRYNLALVGPPPFDPKVVAARREEGWRDGLEQAVGEWADIVAKEVRGEEALTRENGAGPLVEPS